MQLWKLIGHVFGQDAKLRCILKVFISLIKCNEKLESHQTVINNCNSIQAIIGLNCGDYLMIRFLSEVSIALLKGSKWSSRNLLNAIIFICCLFIVIFPD